MAVTTTLANCNVNPALNGPDGSDLLNVCDDAIRNALSFIAQLRDGVQTGGGALWMTGMLAQFATPTTPTGWLKCNGQLVSRTTYASLFAFASAAGLVSEATWSAGSFGCFSVGDGATTFRLPDMRGVHPRGLDEGIGRDPGRVLGVFQDSDVKSHTHGVTDPSHGHTGVTSLNGAHGHTVNDPTHSHTIPNDVSNSFPPGSAGLSGTGNIGAGSYATAAASTGVTVNATTDHQHSFTTNGAATGISVQSTGIAENRVKNIAYPFYVKF